MEISQSQAYSFHFPNIPPISSITTIAHSSLNFCFLFYAYINSHHNSPVTLATGFAKNEGIGNKVVVKVVNFLDFGRLWLITIFHYKGKILTWKIHYRNLVSQREQMRRMSVISDLRYEWKYEVRWQFFKFAIFLSDDFW